MSYAAYILRKIAQNPWRALGSAGKWISEARLDRRIGISSVRRDFTPHGSASGDSHPCQPAPYSLLALIEEDILSRGPLGTFIDIGCGAGRALAYFSKLPFERMLGIEINPDAANLARKNMDRIRPEWRRARRIEILTADILEAEVSLPGCILYLANPFGDATMAAFARKLATQLQAGGAGATTLYYVLPEHAEALAKTFPGEAKRTIQGIEPCIVFDFAAGGARD